MTVPQFLLMLFVLVTSLSYGCAKLFVYTCQAVPSTLYGLLGYVRRKNPELFQAVVLDFGVFAPPKPQEWGGLTLPGWFCPHCSIFNGEAKEMRSECRSCGRVKEAAGLVPPKAG